MISKFAFLSHLLLAVASPWTPSQSDARHHENLLTNQIRSDARSLDSGDWAGAMWSKPAKTFDTVTGTFTVPSVPQDTPHDSLVSFSVRIDGGTCNEVSFKTGVDLSFSTMDKRTKYRAWYGWSNVNFFDYSEITISEGDIVTAMLTVYSPTSGIAIIENVITGEKASRVVTSGKPPLCQKDASWRVESQHYPPNFKTITFYDTFAGNNLTSTQYYPSGARIFEIQEASKTYTSVTTNADAMTIDYI